MRIDERRESERELVRDSETVRSKKTAEVR